MVYFFYFVVFCTTRHIIFFLHMSYCTFERISLENKCRKHETGSKSHLNTQNSHWETLFLAKNDQIYLINENNWKEQNDPLLFYLLKIICELVLVVKIMRFETKRTHFCMKTILTRSTSLLTFIPTFFLLQYWKLCPITDIFL